MALKLPGVSPAREDAAIASQQRRLTGTTPALLKNFARAPWRYLPKAKALPRSAGRTPKIVG